MPTLLVRPAKPWPGEALWAANVPELNRKILYRAWEDLGIVEEPPGSNRGPQIDTYLRRASVPESLITSGKGWWCAAWAGCMWIDAGAKTPRDFGSCDAWLPFLEPKGCVPQIGDAILYGKTGDAVHIGIVARTAPMLLTIEGNRAFGGASNNGVAVDIGPPNRSDILGYVKPVSATL